MSDDKKSGKPSEPNPTRVVAFAAMAMAVICMAVIAYVRNQYTDFYASKGTELSHFTVLCMSSYWFYVLPAGLACFAYFVSMLAPKGLGVAVNAVIVVAIFIIMVSFFMGVNSITVKVIDQLLELPKLIPGTTTTPITPK
ncbi:MAG: hypothetical protein ABIF71_12165 [Planctomycetota bacterium]